MRSLPGCCRFRWLVSLLLLASIVQMNVTRICGQEAAEQGAMNSLHLVLLRPSGEGLASCPVHFSGRIGNVRLNKRAETSEDGSVELEYAKGTINYLRLSIKQPGFVPVYYSWDSDNTEIELPKELTIKLQRGREIRGRVVDDMHQPIQNASVRISAPVTWPMRDSYLFGLATLRTDAAGNWRFADAPQDIGRISVRVSHPDYKEGRSQAKEVSVTVTLEKGISLPGRVLDTEGNPIAGAVVRLGPDRFGTDKTEARTDEEGRFELKNCELGKTVLTVQAPGFSPQILDVDVKDKNEVGVALRLEPPHTLRIRVIDQDGEPIPNVQFAVDGWRGYRSLEHRGRTNSNGEAIWESAPPDAMICDFFKSGRMANRDVPCVPGEEFNVVTLYPELEISGRVIDREGEKLVASFRMIRGQNQSNLRETYWRTDETHAFENGAFRFNFDEPMKSWQLKVIAEGYKPKVSREFKSTEGRVRYSFLLERASTLSGFVMDASGDPVEDAQVVVASSGNSVVMQNGYLDLRESASKPVYSATDGGFTVTLPEEGFFLLIAVHEDGFSELSKANISEDQVVKLQPWGKVAGVSMLGDSIDAGRDISYFAKRPRDGRSFGMVEYDYETSTDEGGKFELDRVIPGAGSVSRVLVVDYGTGSLHSPGWQVPVDVSPGSKNEVKIGGEGFKVSGKLTTARKPPQDTEWKFEPSLSLEAFNKKTGQRTEPFTRYSGKVEEDGSFQVQDVPAGYYRIRTEVNAIGAQKRIAGTLGRLLTHVSISSDATDVGELAIPLDDTLEPGETMPVFAAETLDGRLLDSRDLRKGIVFINFWSTYSKESLGQTAQLGSVLESIDRDRPILFLSLATEEQVEAAWDEVETRGWIQEELPWFHVYAGPRNATTCKSFCLKNSSSNFLFGPDGVLVAKNIPTQDIPASVKKLMKEANFEAEPAPRQSRFAIERFEAVQGSNNSHTEARGAVFVVSDAKLDEEVNNDQNSLIAFDEGLKEQWRITIPQIYPGSSHSILLDRERDRLYVCDASSKQFIAFDLSGKKIWQVSDIAASCAALDTKTGNIWVSGGGNIQFGETAVLDSNGNEVLSLPWNAIDSIYHPDTDTFWLIGKHLIIANRDGTLVHRSRVKGHSYRSISLDAESGQVWIAERDHPDVAGSVNRLLIFNADGSREKEIKLGESDPYAVEWVSGGTALFGGYNSGLQSVTSEGDRREILPGLKTTEPDRIAGKPESEVGYRVKSISRSQSSPNRLWVVTSKSLLRLDNLEVTAKTELKSRYSATGVGY